MNPAIHALNRFGLGARPGEARGLSDPRGWVRDQLTGPAPLLAAPAGFSEPGAALRGFREAQGSGDRAAVARARAAIRAIVSAEMSGSLERRIAADAAVVERLVAFWSNHLCVSIAGKATLAALAGMYEREAIRPHVLGRFEDMVLASATHPAMLLYLDNAQSIGPESPAAQRRPRGRAGAQRGLNENHARELLELHTLGVDGGYTQEDVQELARILTGWTVGGTPGGGRTRAAANGPVRFVFEPLMHEPGAKVVLRERYVEAGIDEGRRAIRSLCRHPSTARFIATKLVRHFIDDDPPADAVAVVSRAFTRTDGDLRETMGSLVDTAEAWSGAGRKFRTPQDWLVAAMRALDLRRADSLPPLLSQLRHPLWSPPAPNGFADTLQQWADPDSLLNRAELARTIARRVARGFDPGVLLDVVDTEADSTLRNVIGDRAVPADERIAIALAAPAFQWR